MPFKFKRRDFYARPDVLVRNPLLRQFCHSDPHQVRDGWAKPFTRLVPGHEIVGKVTQVGPEVNQSSRVGDLAGVGVMVGQLPHLQNRETMQMEQYCVGRHWPGNLQRHGKRDGKTIAQGGWFAQT